MAKKYGNSLPEEEQRLLVSLSISNKLYPRLKRFRAASTACEGHVLSKEELQELAQQLSYQAIDAYCERIEREHEAMIL